MKQPTFVYAVRLRHMVLPPLSKPFYSHNRTIHIGTTVNLAIGLSNLAYRPRYGLEHSGNMVTELLYVRIYPTKQLASHAASILKRQVWETGMDLPACPWPQPPALPVLLNREYARPSFFDE